MDYTTFVIERFLRLHPLLKKLFIRPLETRVANEVSPTQMLVLFTLKLRGEMNMTQLARELSVSKQQLTKIVDGLAEKEYIARRRAEENRRLILITLTKQGQHFFRQMKAEMTGALLPQFELLSQQDLKELDGAISVIEEKLEKIAEKQQ
jgi:DNA-binding MarR family transcriptional regulator